MGKTRTLPEHAQLLEGVRIASAGNALGVPLAGMDPLSRQSMAQQALRWTYVLRSRQRWVRDAKVREQHQALARETLDELSPQEVFERRLQQEDLPPELAQALAERYRGVVHALQQGSAEAEGAAA